MEESCTPELAPARWAAARAEGATGAVSSRGSGIAGRSTLTLFWELLGDSPRPAGQDLVEENWTPYWRETLSRVIPVSSGIALVPAWEEPPPGTPCTLRIDPGMAFGAGDHPSTRLCLRLLEAIACAGRLPHRVLDVGSGTGVLALAAACLGATEVDALDIDPFGYAACRRNARLNGLEGKVHPILLSLDLLDRTYPLVLANVAASQLCALAMLLRESIEPEGQAVLSGFEADAESRVLSAVGLTAEMRLEEEGWVGLLVRSPSR